ncbi:HAD family hydrolase [Maribacter sp. BPC-D8]|uniref:HAD family hydrolase n=1 Tax=Maribacter sp. BPC-D8 TaxID=3053613 RepID=UPI002B48C364|nr:HAD family hydrolase [Maribacter sp. BPC-D8]WRI31289.1 HAD family hydrolase [Maribacter sp. BPC-D8]
MNIKINEDTALIFDLDDTLYNELSFLKSAYWDICFNLKPEQAKSLYNQVFSLYRSGKNPFLFLSKTFSIPTEHLLKKYRNHIPTIEPFPGVMDTIKMVKANKGKLGIVTDGREITQTNKLKSLGIFQHMDYCVISESLGSEKPNPANFQKIENELKVETYYYFGDNFKKDFIAPRKMGWHTVGLIDNGMNIHSNSHNYQENRPEYLIQSFLDINIT